MADSIRDRLADQLETLRRSFAQGSRLPFADLLATEVWPAAWTTAPASEPVYTPVLTLTLFLSQVIAADPSCQQTVASLQAWQAATGQGCVAAHTGAYCKARQRLAEADLHQLVQQTGRRLHQQAPHTWRWAHRPVKIIDGTTVSMPDTPANQAVYPQPDGQRPGLGFPMLRLGVLLSLETGAVVDAALAPYRGKGTGEVTLLRQLWQHLQPGDVLLGDRIDCSYFEIALLAQRGVDVILHKHQSRRTDFRTGVRRGPCDHVVTWSKPARPAWLAPALYAALPATLTVREVAVRVPGPNRRRRRLVLVTTLQDPQAFPPAQVGGGYQQRWHGELDLRSIKQVLHLEMLRCKSPPMVRKEIWAHLLAYNLLRGVLAAAAVRHGVPARRLSFKGVQQTLNAFRAGLLHGTIPATAAGLTPLLDAVAAQRVGDRPGRVEPRARKRRNKKYPFLTEPRPRAREKLRRQRT